MTKLGCRFCAQACACGAHWRYCWLSEPWLRARVDESTAVSPIPAALLIPDATVTITNDATGVSNHTQSQQKRRLFLPDRRRRHLHDRVRGHWL